MALCVWYLSLSKTFSRFTHVVACVSGLFLFYGWIAFHYISAPHFFIHSSGDGRMGCFHLFAILNSAAVNIHAQIFVSAPILSVFKLFKLVTWYICFFKKKRISYFKLKYSLHAASQVHRKMILHIYILFQILSIIGYYRILTVVPHAIQWVLVVIYFIYNSVYLLTPNSEFVPSFLLPLW